MSTQLLEVFSGENAGGVAYKNKSLKRLIINLLDQSGNATIADMSAQLNISTPKIIALVNELIVDGVLKDYGKVDSTGGRRASLYGLLSEAAFFVGIDVKRYAVNIGLLDFKKNLITVKEQIPFVLENTSASFESLMLIIEEFLNEITPQQKSKVLAMGLNLSGRINNKTGYSYSFYHFHEAPLSDIITQRTGVKTFLENDSRSMAYGEFRAGVVTNEKNVLFVNVDYGVGLGILVDGKVYYGKSGFSGEFGHIPFFDNEIICHCGKKGCLETEASGNALLRLFKEAILSGSKSQLIENGMEVDDVKLQHIIESAGNEDMLCIELIAKVGEKLGKGLAVLMNIFNPDLVILGGTLAQTSEYLRLPLKSALNKYSLSLVNNDSQLRMTRLGEKAGVFGSCLIARTKIFEQYLSESF